MTTIASGQIWTWFNSPKAFARGDSIYVAAFNGSRQRPVVHRIDLSGGDIRSAYPAPATGGTAETDDHDDPAIVRLKSGKILIAWSQHSGANSFCATTASGLDIATFGTPVQVTSGGEVSYAQLLQASDDTIFWFSRVRQSGTTRSQVYRTSTDDGATWSSAVEFMRETDERPYFRWFRTSGTRFDFFFNNAHPGEAVTSLYHGYLTIAGGIWTAHQTDGTLVGDVDDLPFAPTDFSLVYDGSTSESWIWDGRFIGGAPACVFSVFPSHGTSSHEYHRGIWTGSAWSTEKICDAGTSGTADYLYAVQANYSGGICLNPLSAATVYVSREYGSDDFRVEEWTRGASNWSKTTDLSGDTGTINARPIAVYNNGTRVLWWGGNYTSYTSFDTDIQLYPSLTVRSAKPATPTLRSEFAPPGSKLLLPCQEGSGTPADFTGAYTLAKVGTITWGSAAIGAHLSGWSTSNHLTFDAFAAAWAAGGFPKWAALLFANADTTQNQRLFSLGYSGYTQPRNEIIINTGATGTVSWLAAGNTSTTATTSGTSQPCNDGELHVIMGASAAANLHNIYFDGLSIAVSGLTIQTQSNLNQATIGTQRTNSVANPFLGNIYAVAAGFGAMPNPADLYLDWINGRFSGFGGTPLAAPPLGASRLFSSPIFLRGL